MNHLKEIVPDRPSRGIGPSRGEDCVFTLFLQSIEPDRPWGEDGGGDGFAEVWQALRRLLVSELKRRSLWTLPPAYLGIYGSASWADEEALAELTADSFLFVFGERLRSLKAQLCCKPNVEGLILRSVRNFLHEAQKRHDPVGFRVFTVLRGAVRASVAAGTLHGIAGSPAVRRDTVLAFEPGRSSTEAVPPARLASEVRLWNDDLLPDLITARGWEVPPLLARVEEHLRGLAVHGVAVFRFQDVVDPLRDDVRSRWRALWAGTQGEVGCEQGEEDLSTIVHLVAPIGGLEERESFRALLDCLERGIASLTERPQGKEYLRRLQMFLRNYAADTDGASAGEDERLPSHRRLAELLGIPRERLPGLFGTLQKLAAACLRREGWVSLR